MKFTLIHKNNYSETILGSLREDIRKCNELSCWAMHKNCIKFSSNQFCYYFSFLILSAENSIISAVWTWYISCSKSIRNFNLIFALLTTIALNLMRVWVVDLPFKTIQTIIKYILVHYSRWFMIYWTLNRVFASNVTKQNHVFTTQLTQANWQLLKFANNFTKKSVRIKQSQLNKLESIMHQLFQQNIVVRSNLLIFFRFLFLFFQ